MKVIFPFIFEKKLGRIISKSKCRLPSRAGSCPAGLPADPAPVTQPPVLLEATVGPASCHRLDSLSEQMARGRCEHVTRPSATRDRLLRDSLV